MKDDIKAIRAVLAAGPTPGEWVACGPSFGDPLPRFLNEVVSPDEADGGETVACALQGAEGLADADMAYIAACNPERIARLLDALEQAQSALAAERERAAQLDAKLQDAENFLQELQERDSE